MVERTTMKVSAIQPTKSGLLANFLSLSFLLKGDCAMSFPATYAQSINLLRYAVVQRIALALVVLTVSQLAQAADPGMLITLANVSRAEVASVDTPINQHAGNLLQTGFARALPEPIRINGRQLSWHTLGDGSQQSTVSLRSPEALGVRIALQLDTAPSGTMLVFPDANGTPLQRFASSKLLTSPIWGPASVGDTTTLIWHLPAASTPDTLQFALTGVSHLYRDAQGKLLGNAFAGIGDALSCNLDIACQPEAQARSSSASVARMQWTDGAGRTFSCSGTLLADTINSRTPYFLTARHCMPSASIAASLQTEWFFQSQTCGSTEQQTSIWLRSGADLLALGGNADFALLKLRDPAPDGAIFAKWDAAFSGSQQDRSVFTVHHPRADIKSYSAGKISDYLQCISQGEQAICDRGIAGLSGSSLLLGWNQGYTDQGSSGAGVFYSGADQQDYLIGILASSDTAKCGRSQTASASRFATIFPSLQRWLAPDQPPGRFVNLSTRAYVGTGDQIVIAGFIIRGGPKKLLLTGKGPSLASNSTGDEILSDPTLVLFEGTNAIARNDDWENDPAAAEMRAFGIAPEHSREAAMILTLQEGAYTLHLTGAGQGTGLGLVEVFDVDDPAAPGRLSNLSTRAFASTGGNQRAIAGFIIRGGNKSVAISSVNLGVPGWLRDTALNLYAGGKSIAANDNVRQAYNFADIQQQWQANPAVTHDVDYEAGLLQTLPEGAYTAIMRGVGSNGVALVAIDEPND